MLKNPIIPGYYPDPSICRVGDDFYLACSSFELWPGVPIFHSKDLAHWEQIANAVSAENGFHTERNAGVGGVMAPTLRYCNGKFYIINANFADRGNYIVTAEDPRGPWSEIHWLDDVPGIDASIFFDDDGSAYIMGTGNVWDNGAGQKERGIWLAPYDVENFRLAGEPVCIFNSALRVGSSPEAPHLYHIGEYYYLIIAEGGTEHFHSVMVARSKELFGFYEGCPANPVLTHRHMGYTCPITNVGHADLVELPDGSWYAVFLASRLIGGNHKNLGRETFICPVTWERDWPMFSAKTGKVEWEYESPACLPVCEYPPEPAFDDFDGDALALHWTFWGEPAEGIWALRDSAVSLKCVRQQLNDELQPMGMDGLRHNENYAAFLARRQRQANTTVTAKLRFAPQAAEKAGLAVVQGMNHQLHLYLAQEGGALVVRADISTAEYPCPPYFPGFTSQTTTETLAQAPWSAPEIVLRIEMAGQDWAVYYGASPEDLRLLAKVDGRIINPEKVGCMVGTMLGMFATGSGVESDNRAEFDWFELKD